MLSLNFSPDGKVDLRNAGQTLRAVKEIDYKLHFTGPDVRYHDPIRKIMVIERPPTTYTLQGAAYSFEDALSSVNEDCAAWIAERRAVQKVPFPWHVIVVNYSRGALQSKMFFRNEPMSSLADPVCIPFIDHIQSNGKPCQPLEALVHRSIGNLSEMTPYDTSIGVFAYQFLDGISYGFSYHSLENLPPALREKLPPRTQLANHPWTSMYNINHILDQEYDVLSVLDLEMIEYEHTIEDVIKGMQDHHVSASTVFDFLTGR